MSGRVSEAGLEWSMSEDILNAEQVVCNATLMERHDYTAELSVVRVRPDSGVVPDFVPGQFIKLGLPREGCELRVSTYLDSDRTRTAPRMIRRAYSIASSPLQREFLEFIVVRVETGKLTPRLWTMDVGGRVWMDNQVNGRFTLEPIPPDKDVVMVATGTGIAPYMSMLRTYIDEPPWRRVVVINGVRYEADLGYRAELEAMVRVHPDMRYIPVVSREPEGGPWTGLRGHVQQVLEPAIYESLVGSPLDPHQCHVMLCGNPAMVIDVHELLEQRGFRTHSSQQPGNIHFERYW